jgi:dihydropyrimidinase
VPHDLIIKNGTLITAHHTFEADVAISGERIAAIGQNLSGTREINARGLYVLPGAIDAHVHLTDPRYAPLYVPGADSFAVGTRAAAFGGTTCIVDFAAPAAGVPLVEELDRRQEEADGQVVVDYALNLTLRDTDPARIPELHAIFDRHITSIKLFMAYEGYQLDDVTLLRAMEVVAARNGLAVLHAENYDVIRELRRRLGPGLHDYDAQVAACPSVMEGEAVHRVIALAKHTGARLLIYHQSCEEGVREIAAAKARRQAVFGEVCVQHLVYTSSDQARALQHGYSLMMGPPIREAHQQAALWRGLADGSLDMVSTDHGPRPRKPGQPGQGMSGIETRLALVHHFGVRAGRISLNRWVETCCTNPALIFGLPRKGQLLPGFEADIVLFDPNQPYTFTAATLHSAIDYCSYEGLSVMGYPVTTMSRGEVIVADGEYVGQPGRGRFIERVPLSRWERGEG